MSVQALPESKRGVFYYYSLVIDSISKFFATISTVLLIITAFVVILDAAARTLGKPFMWATDWATYLLIFFIFLCLSDGLRAGHHISADVLVSRMNPKMKKLMDVISMVFCLVTCSILTYYFIPWALESIKTGERDSFTYNLLYMWPAKCIAALSFLVMCFMAVKVLIVNIKELCSKDLGSYGSGISNPYIVLPIFLVLLVLSCVFLNSVPILGLAILLITLLVAGLPIAIAVLTTTMLVFSITFGHMDNMVATIPSITYEYVNRYTLLALPMFVFAGKVMADGGIGEGIFNFAKALVGHIRGGIGIAVVVACAIFGALSGSASACALTIGSIGYPVLVKNGYNKGTAAGLIAISGGIGILIPPSNAFLTYGLVTETSIGRLFITGLMPGILMAVFLSVALMIMVKRQNVMPSPKASFKEVVHVTKKSFWSLMMPIVVLGGLYSGFFTITEAAAVSAVYAVVYTLLAKTLTIKQVWKVAIKSINTVAFLQFILMITKSMQRGITLMRIPQLFIQMLGDTPGWVFILIIMVFVLFLGMFLEGSAITCLLVPILVPILRNYNYDLYWFAAILVVNETIASVTPPVGINLFIMQKMGGLEAAEVFKGAVPFVLAVCVLLVVLSLFPQISLFLPSFMG